MVKTILCVDDIKTNLLMLRSIFEDYNESSYEIITVSSGKDALDVLKSRKIDLILLDIMMPEMDGYETAQQIVINDKTKDIPIIFLTAKKDEESISRCYEVGGVDYVNKPYNAVELFSRIKFHLDLVDSREILLQEKIFVQDILDLQENLIIVTDGLGAIRINKATSDFFDLNEIDRFFENFLCLNDMFIQEDGFFHMGLEEEKISWISVLLEQLKEKDCKVLLKNVKTDNNEIFDIKVKEFKNNHLIILTNITTIAEESKHYEHDASYDDLTQIYNRSKLNEILNTEIPLLSKNNANMSFVLLDIDHFKSVNDTYGHLVGDDVLIKMSQLIKNHIRQTDVFARWGGEEFVLVLPNVDINKAEDIANNLRVKIELEYFAQVNHITCSFGVTSFKSNDNIDTLTQRADKALYEAKQNGRNMVCKLI